MASVESRVVEMKFDNRQFENRVGETMSTLDKLKQALGFKGATKGLEDVGKAAGNLDLSSIANGVENISSKFSALGVIGFTVIQDLTRMAIDFGKKMANQLIDPIVGGGKRRAENIEQAKFMFRGLGMDIEAAMESARLAVTGTAYGLDDAARAASQLGGSGLQAGEEMTSALRGIAGIAAMTNTSYAEMADIFVTGAGKGKIMGMELQRISHRGVNAAAALGKVWGKTEQEVREMASNSEISFEMFYSAMDEAFGEHATKANETYAGSLANMRAALSRLGASFFTDRLTQQRDLFNALTPVIDDVHDALKPLISTMTELTGLGTEGLVSFLEGIDTSNLEEAMPNFADALKFAYIDLKNVFGEVKKAFRDIFPKSGESAIIKLSEAVRTLMFHLSPSVDTLEKIRSIFRGVFSVLAIGWEVVKNVANVFKELFASFSKNSDGGILDFFSRIAEGVVKLKEALVDGGKITEFFEKYINPIARFIGALDIGGALGFIADGFVVLAGAISKLFGGTSNAAIDAMGGAFARLGERWGWLITVGEKFIQFMGWLKDKVQEGARAVARELGNIFGKLVESFADGDFSPVFDAINTGLFAGLVLIVRNFLKNGFNLSLGDGIFGSITGAFEQLTGTMKAMQTQLKADALMKIAIAIGVLTVSVVALSMIDSVSLTKAMIAIAVGFGQLAAAMAILTHLIHGPMGAAKLVTLSIGLILLAGAIVVLSLAVKILSTMDMGELAKGLLGVGALLAGVTLAVNNMPPAKGLIRTSIAIMLLAAGIVILSLAVKLMATMSWGEMIQGLVGVGAALAGLILAMNKMPDKKGLVRTGIALIAIGIGLNIIALAVKQFGSMDFGELAQGLIAIGAALLIVAGAMHVMPGDKSLLKTGGGLILIGIGLNIMALAIKQLGSMDLGSLVQGLIGVAAALAILAIAAHVMSGTIMGALAITILASSLLILATAIAAFSSIGFGNVLIALGSIVAVLIVLAVASLLMVKITPALAALGLALILVGAGFALFGAAALMVATAIFLVVAAIVMLANVGGEGIAAVIGFLNAFIERIPAIALALAEGFVLAVKTFLESVPELTGALTIALTAILDMIIEMAPKFGEAMTVLIQEMLKTIRDNFPDILVTGIEMLMVLLYGILASIGTITDVVSQIIIAFLESLGARMGEIVTAGMQLFKAFLDGIAANIGDLVTSAVDILDEFLKGIGDNIQRVIDSGVDVLVKFIEGIGKNFDRLLTAGWNLIIGLINSITLSVTANMPQLREAGAKLAFAIVDGMTMGLASKAKSVWDAGWNLGKRAIEGGMEAVGAKSPSREAMKIGGYIGQGLALGMDQDKTAVESAKVAAQKVLNAINESVASATHSLEGMSEFSPTITPVIDLSEVKRGMAQMNSTMKTPVVDAEVSFNQASVLAVADRQRLIPDDKPAPAPETKEIKFEQNNYSPTALSTSELYRQTRSQISLAKEELKT